MDTRVLYTALSSKSERSERQQGPCMKDLERVQRGETEMTKEGDNGTFRGCKRNGSAWKADRQPQRSCRWCPCVRVRGADLPGSISLGMKQENQ